MFKIRAKTVLISENAVTQVHGSCLLRGLRINIIIIIIVIIIIIIVIVNKLLLSLLLLLLLLLSLLPLTS